MARTARIRRETGETRIDLGIDLDGSGRADVATGVGFFDHMLTLLAKHSLIDLSVKADGDLHVDAHHTVEDVGICLGQALAQALGNKAGIRRYGSLTLPMDETLVTAAVDLSGRPFCVWCAEVPLETLGNFNGPLAEEFWRAVSSAGAFNLHVVLHHGRNTHHVIEGIFKATARALRQAVEPDPRVSGVPSTKGVLEAVGTLTRFAAHFRAELHALRDSFRARAADPSRQAALLLHRMMFRRFLREAGFECPPLPEIALPDAFLDGYRWSLDDRPSDEALTPDVFGCLFDKHVSRKDTGTYYTGRDVSDYIARGTILPAVLGAVSDRPVNDLVTENIDLAGFAADAVGRCDRADGLRAVWDALLGLTVLDPTCGCGEFLVAALRVLEPLYEACLARMRSLPGRTFSAILTAAERHPTGRHFVRATILRRNLYGLDLMPEAVEITRMRLHLMLAAAARGTNDLPPLLNLDDRLRAGDVLAVPEPFPHGARPGGFSVVLGNPPYVESAAPGAFRTATCGNLYAFVVERGLGLLAPDGRMGMIVPHSAFCTDRMAPLASLLLRRGVTWVSTYDIRPCKLFRGVDQRLAIFLSAPAPQPRTFSTRYHRWHEADRPFLFRRLRYLDVGSMQYENSVPKAGDPIAERLWHKIHRRAPLREGLGGGAVVYYHNAPRYWVRALTFAPYFWNERDGGKLSAQVRALPVQDTADAGAVAALLNSSLFCWWWLLLSDCRHLNRREIDRFPVGLAEMPRDCKRALGALCRRLMADYRRHAVRKVCRYRATGKVVYDEFYPGRSKAILDEIDRALAGHYGFTDKELDFVINYDIKYRLGGE